MEIYALWAEDGTLARFKDRGGRFEEEEGFLGADIIELFYVVSLGVSAGNSKSTLGADTGERLDEMDTEWSIRIISSDADNFAAIGRDATSGHLDRIRIQFFWFKFAKGLPMMEDLVVLYSGKMPLAKSWRRSRKSPTSLFASVPQCDFLLDRYFFHHADRIDSLRSDLSSCLRMLH